MYLKEIKIAGFKSFADKIDITLDNRTTCIVGPNGSGKSNIVDAVRWVLGEQSIKSLRGDNAMVDVIFSGSKTRAPLNIASVTLVFDNSDSYIKTPYTEIAVTRKLYKSGENEYYINNDKCRLKDISDLFLDTGMGKASFNIVSQGEISKIVSDSALERRSILEEAAGVLKYKKRKEEALRKLERTRDNLSRIKDIIDELSIQVEPLKEQSEQAKKYFELKEKLEAIEVSLIVNDLDTLNFDYQQTKNSIEDVQTKLIKITTESSKNDAELEVKKKVLMELQTKFSELNQQLIELTKEEERLNGEKNIIKERGKYKADDARVHENISLLKEKELQLNNNLISLNKEIAMIDVDKSTNSEAFKKVSSELENVANKRNSLDMEISNNNKKIVDASYKIDSLNNYISTNGTTSRSVKDILNNPKLRGVHNTIANLIDVPDEYCIATEIALGGAKDYVVVDNRDNAKSCIEYLKTNDLGRVTFYPLDVIKPRSIDPSSLEIITKQDGYIGIIGDLIKYDVQYYNIIYNQLGATILVNTLDSANEVSRMVNNKYKVVTLSGEIVNVGGSITGGSIKTSKSIISEKYALQQLIREQTSLKDKVKALSDEVKTFIDKEQELRKSFTAYATEDIRLKELITSKKNQYEDLSQEQKTVLKELNNLDATINNSYSSEEEEITKKYYHVLNEKDDVTKQLTIVTKKKEDEENKIENLQVSYRMNNTEVRSYEEKLKQYEIMVSKMDIKMDMLLATLTDNYSMTYEKAKANYILDMNADIARKQVNAYKNEIKNIGVVNIGAIEEYERVNTRYEFLNNQSNDLNKAMDTLLGIIEELDHAMETEFIYTFNKVKDEFSKTFKELFGGGEANLSLTDPTNILETGVDIMVNPQGKKLSTISLLSGGEKALTAISLLFAILNVKKVPFCLFDEVEAALDEANVDSFGKYLNKYKDKTQFLIITHKKKTMEYADTLYGITMQESGVSKLVSVRLVDNHA